jgi:hypothetical protein
MLDTTAISNMSATDLETLIAEATARKSQLENDFALQYRDELKKEIGLLFDQFKEQVILNCGSSTTMLEEANEKLKTFKLSMFLSGVKEIKKPLEGIPTSNGISDLSDLILNPISRESDWARKATQNANYIIFRDGKLYWVSTTNKITLIENIRDDKLVLEAFHGRLPNLRSISGPVCIFLTEFFK